MKVNKRKSITEFLPEQKHETLNKVAKVVMPSNGRFWIERYVTEHLHTGEWTVDRQRCEGNGGLREESLS